MKNTTHFGYRQVATDEKAYLVAQVFQSVAPKYDLMNDFMSFGLHRLWKRFTIRQAAVRPGQWVLDVAAGTGDLTQSFAKRVGPSGKVFMTDINEAMLLTGRDRMINAGLVGNIEYLQADAQQLPFADDTFDRISIAFGLRNVTDKAAALAAMYRVLKPGGKLLILEFSHPALPWLQTCYDFYSFKMIPKLGQLIAHDAASYQYLVESIRMHPTQAALKTMLETAGFETVDYFNMSGGIVALHTGYKY